MLKVWGRLNSVNVQKVLWCAAEMGVRFERIDAGMQFGVNTTPEFKAMNPNGLVPVIDDDGFILWESHAIVRYLAARYALGSPCPTLCPVSRTAHADCDRWMDWSAIMVWPEMRPILLNLVRLPPEQRDMALVAAARDRLAARLALLDTHLAGREYVTGAHFTMADIPLGSVVQRWFNLPIKREPLPRIQAYYETLRGRPAFRQYADLPLS